MFDENYWKRRCVEELSWQNCHIAEHGMTWKQLFFEVSTPAQKAVMSCGKKSQQFERVREMCCLLSRRYSSVELILRLDTVGMALNSHHNHHYRQEPDRSLGDNSKIPSILRFTLLGAFFRGGRHTDSREPPLGNIRRARGDIRATPRSSDIVPGAPTVTSIASHVAIQVIPHRSMKGTRAVPNILSINGFTTPGYTSPGHSFPLPPSSAHLPLSSHLTRQVQSCVLGRRGMFQKGLLKNMGFIVDTSSMD